ncbi:MAG: bifunctional glutamate N-acetyltransferase/amino-acid acetyltransferase ArgJ [Clostridia bacterium]|nr:bifunctional glutamate N-acetyltransferase/amino-acid acetyltransferase ArgJ [Clostridia bacterium]
MKFINGGVCAASGFLANGIHCGIRKNHSKKDLSLVFSASPATAAAVYTRNLVKGAPLTVTGRNISNGIARAMICNSGNANTCNADGILIAEEMCRLTGSALSIDPSDVIVASTGVIGQPLSLDPVSDGMDKLVHGLSKNGNQAAAEAIMTTDTRLKESAVEFELSGKTCRLGGMAKGSGMIHPNMATMLVFLTTDVAISAEMLRLALSDDVGGTFNMISVDGDTSTNDMVSVMANGNAGNEPITAACDDFEIFKEALHAVTVSLSRKIAADGEGATKLLECTVSGAQSLLIARTVARSVISSTLLKAAMFGADANWGRVLCAIGYSGADVDVSKIDICFRSTAGAVNVCRQGAGIDFSEDAAKAVLSEDEIAILVNLNSGNESATAWGCDLTYDYVKINGDYRT